MYIVVEGNIGAGKTTLAKALSEALGAFFLPERFEENPYLPQFYEDRSKFALPTELWFLLDRFNQNQQLVKCEGLIVSDYHIHKSDAFASVNLPANELEIFRSVLLELENSKDVFRNPDMVIFLDIPAAKLHEQVTERGRIYEQQMDTAYLAAIAASYRNYIARISTTRMIRYTNHKELDLGLLVNLIREQS
jgi:deoxyadenosine/deoxycytidine kinase